VFKRLLIRRVLAAATAATAAAFATGSVLAADPWSPFLTGFIKNNEYLGRPVDVLVLKDGSLPVSDDHAGAIYRVSDAGS